MTIVARSRFRRAKRYQLLPPWSNYFLILIFSFVAALSLTATCHAYIQETKYSRFGEITFVSDPNDTTKHILSLNGRAIYTAQGLYSGIEEIVSTRTRDYLLLNFETGGSGGVTLYTIVIVGPNGLHGAFEGLDLRTENNRPQHKVQDGELWLSLQDEGMFEQFAVFADDKMRTARQRLAQQRPVAHDLCQWLYTGALDECAQMRPQCNEAFDTLSGASSRGVYGTAHRFPRFQVQSFAILCQQTCRAGRVVIQYRDFSRQLCGQF